jgi:hypothetical protein
VSYYGAKHDQKPAKAYQGGNETLSRAKQNPLYGEEKSYRDENTPSTIARPS